MKLISLFDGIGCFPLAWAYANKIDYKELEYDSSEIMPFLCDVIKENFPKSNQLFNIEEVDCKTLSGDIITMGTPCTGFSLSGNRDGLQNVESKLFKNGVEAIKEVQPKYFVWENVYGVLSANKGLEFRAILDEFKKIGYDVIWTTYDSQFFTVPHRRRRIYMIGVKDGIPKNHNIYSFFKRSSESLIKETKELAKFREFDFNKESQSPTEHYAIFNRQRSDTFKEIGLSSTLAKRDYKSFMDLVVKNGSLRRIVPKERLRLQGIPDNWFDCTYKDYKTDKPRFQANGMTVPVVQHVFENLLGIENGTLLGDEFEDNMAEIMNSNKSHYYIDKTSTNIYFKKNSEFKNMPTSGQVRLKRDKNGKVTSDNAEYLLIEHLAESSDEIKISDIQDYLLDRVEDKFHISEGGCDGILRREAESGLPLPQKLKEVILYKYPSLKEKY